MTNTRKVLPALRRHTFHFLEHAREIQPVYLSIDVDASNIMQSRASYKQANISISYISYVILAISKAIEVFPEVNISVQGKWFPKMISYNEISAKFTLDKMVKDQRIVVSSVIPKSNEKSVLGIQKVIEKMKNTSFQEEESFQGVRKLQKLPVWFGGMIYRQIIKKADKRLATQGSFTVTSLGHLPVDHFYPITSNTTCFGVGAITDKPIIKDGNLIVKPILPLCMTFDHRAIDGALAAEFLYSIKNMIENWGEEQWQEDQKGPSMTLL